MTPPKNIMVIVHLTVK